jgi:hypothetical protein
MGRYAQIRQLYPSIYAVKKIEKKYYEGQSSNWLNIFLSLISSWLVVDWFYQGIIYLETLYLFIFLREKRHRPYKIFLHVQ